MLRTLLLACSISVMTSLVLLAEEKLSIPQAGQAPATNYTNLERGLAFVAERNWDKAVVEFTAMIELDPKDATAYEYRGCAYFMKSELDKAITDLTQAIQLNPTNSSAYFNRGGAFRVKEELAKAVSDFSSCLRFAPSNHLAFKSRAAIYNRMGDYAKAIRDWNGGLGLYPEDAAALGARGFSYQNLGQFTKAIESYRESLRHAPKQAGILNQLAWIQAACPDESARNGRESVKAAKEACELTNWQSSQFIDTLAAAFAEVGDFSSAVKYQKQAVKLGNTNEVVLGQMKGRLFLFEKNQAFREAKNASPPD
jgi:tetratricopeptide (TPR) repeat protein